MNPQSSSRLLLYSKVGAAFGCGAFFITHLIPMTGYVNVMAWMHSSALSLLGVTNTVGNVAGAIYILAWGAFPAVGAAIGAVVGVLFPASSIKDELPDGTRPDTSHVRPPTSTDNGLGPVNKKPNIDPTSAKLLEIQALKKSTNLLLEIALPSGERQLFNKENGLAILRKGIIEGTFNATSTIDVHYKKDQDSDWSITNVTLAEFAKEHFELRIEYEHPIWTHALAGLKWGALIGGFLKLIDTFMLLHSVNRHLGDIFFMTVMMAIFLTLALRVGFENIGSRVGLENRPVLFIIAFGALIIFQLMGQMDMAQKQQMIKVIGMISGAASVGAILCCLPGMAVGGAIGLVRQKSLPRAKDALPEQGDLVLKTIVFPLVVGSAVWFVYRFYLK
jgi:hypothetical protein